MKSKAILLLCLAVLAAACGKEKTNSSSGATDEEKTVFSASFDDVPSVKTSLNGTKVNWVAGDRISILWDGGSKTAIALSGGEETTFAVNVGDAETFYAVYPEFSSAELSGETINLTVPQAQHGAFADANIAISKTASSDKYFVFKNICALGKITITRSDIAKVRISSGEEDVLAGDVAVSFDAEENPSLDASEATAKELTLTPVSGDAFAVGDYYFSLVPVTLQTVVFTLETSSGEVLPEVKSENSVEFAQSTVTSFGVIDDVTVPVEGYTFPIGVFMKPTPVQLHTQGGTRALLSTTVLDNATLVGNRLTFAGGASIEKTGDIAGVGIQCPAHTAPNNAYAGFQLALSSPTWTAGDSWLLKVPVKEALSGDLRFFYGSRNEKKRGTVTYAWSSDKGTSWNDVNAEPVSGQSEEMWKSLDFTIPVSQEVPAKGEFWFKITYSTDLEYTDVLTDAVCFSNGFAILPQTAEAGVLPEEGELVDDAKVIFSEAFNDLVGTADGYIDFDGSFFRTMTTGTYSSPSYRASIVTLPEGVTVTNCHSRPGFLQVGFADEAMASSTTNYYLSGSYRIDLGSRISDCGWTSANLKVTLKAGSITTAYMESANARPILSASTGTVSNGGVFTGLPMDSWEDYSFTVTGVQADDAVLTFGSFETASSSVCGKVDNRFFIDDILITAVESEAVAPSDDIKLVFDFACTPPDVTPAWPTSNKQYSHVDGGVERVYPLDGTDYVFVLADCGGAKAPGICWSQDSNPRLSITAAQRYFGLPVIDKYALSKVSCTNVTGAGSSAPLIQIVDGIVPNTKQHPEEYDGVNIVSGGESQEWNNPGSGEEYSYNLTGTKAGTRYYIYARRRGCGMARLVLTYKKINE
ncbi:MAG: hypothetical protein IJQ93_11485 [Bacteroidales bacterium]|nr:hypothetical protein [Bacteroidales bacterium]